MLRHLKWTFLFLLSLVLVLNGCGGGESGDTQANGSGVGSGGTGSYTNGPVSGLGSIIVNNVRYDVDTARIRRDDDSEASASRDPAELKLGMMVEVQGSGVTPASTAGATPVATASTVRYGSVLVGPAANVTINLDGSLASLTVHQQRVNANARTVVTRIPTFGDHVEVYGLLDASGVYTATRVEVSSSTPMTYKMVGYVSAVTDRVIYVGQSTVLQAIDYTSLPGGLPAGVGATARIRAWFSPTLSGGAWVATRIVVDQPLVEDIDEASVEGLVTQLPDASGLMKVDSQLVNVRGIIMTTSLTPGERIRVEGRMQSGVLIATELAAGSALEQEESGTELHGQISQVTAQTFVVRGVTVAYTPSVVHENRTLRDGDCVEVHAQGYNSNGQLIATEIEAGDSCH
ncbi:MAG TPA: DUF5666 domain-containing protein [Aquabacterium sp.]|uniref:DUF5666 domain-containing protein n=1 Tax=Aquabacterium sp. TaxID=1872578 RepID=UPI002E342A71|nr:DUF5666 domain-containing protein [Aquabacterium sp.]HEX5355588.1 DUF5666 domain-containing protein [Aquabacterium sp.]